MTQYCCSYGNKPIDSVPVMRITEKLDELFSRNDLLGAEALLNYWADEAEKLSDNRGLLFLNSERVGLYRRLSEKDKGLKACEDALALVSCCGIEDIVSGATVILNCATTMKAFGKTEEALPLYEKARRVYERELLDTDPLLAGLYNNTATAFAELFRISEAEELYLKAVDILKKGATVPGEVAVSYVNLAVMFADSDPFDERVYTYMDMAEKLLLSDELPQDGNYAFICSKCAPAFDRFGYFVTSRELETRSRNIYERT